MDPRFGATRRPRMTAYFEQFGDPVSAIGREKQLKKYNRAWKIELIEKTNLDWTDLYPRIVG